MLQVGLNATAALLLVVGAYGLGFAALRSRSIRQVAVYIIAFLMVCVLATWKVWLPRPGLESTVTGVVLAAGLPAVAVGTALYGRRRDE